MSKYAPLTLHLNRTSSDQVTMSFSELQRILGFSLPNSAKLYYAWWDNDAGSGHTQAKAWLEAGFQTANVNLKASPPRVDFVRKASKSSAKENGQTARRHPAFGALKGMITLLPDVDYSEPADPDWGRVYDE